MQATNRRPLALLVEDDPIVASGIEAMLDLAGFETATFDHGSSAIGALEHLDAAVAFVNIGLPDVSGVDVYRALRAVHPAVPVVFSTGHGEEAAAEAARGDAHATYLIKPYAYERMVEAMRSTGVELPSPEGDP